MIYVFIKDDANLQQNLKLEDVFLEFVQSKVNTMIERKFIIYKFLESSLCGKKYPSNYIFSRDKSKNLKLKN